MSFFPDVEFERVSGRALDASEREAARHFRGVLDALRGEVGHSICLTSFLRSYGLGTHTRGEAVDFQPCRAGVPLATFEARLETMFEHLRRHPDRAALYGTVIHERDHIHLTLPGSQGRFGVAYREPVEKMYVLVTDTIRENGSLVALVVIVILLVIFRPKGTRRK